MTAKTVVLAQKKCSIGLMHNVLITAFEPYDQWPQNASWLALVELTKDLPENPCVTTRLYPVNFDVVREKLSEDLAADYDYVLHLGQAPGSSSVQLESIGVNVGGYPARGEEEMTTLVEGGPVAYQSGLPLSLWVQKLCSKGIPARVSYHAGTYLCNAALYYSHHLIAQRQLKTQATFIHLPIDVQQASTSQQELPCLPKTASADAIRAILDEIASNGVA